MAITAAMVKELRDKTGAGMMDAKKALVETDGDMEAATDLLRVKGLAKADKKSDRTAAEGLVAVAVGGGQGALVEVNSETDFVARNPEFQAMVKAIATAAVGVDDLDALKSAEINGKSVADTLTDMIAKIGENMTLRRMQKMSGTVVASYVHNAVAADMGKIGVLVGINGDDAEKAANIGKQIGMHVAAMNPASLDIDDLDPALIEREKQVLTEQARESGKPDNVIEKMIIGRMNKFYQEVCLTKQALMSPDNPDGLTTEKFVAEAGVEVAGFARFAVGDGIDKDEGDDFATEVAKMAG